MHVLGVWADLVLGEAVERLAHQLEVVAEVAGALGRGQAGQHRRVALRTEEGARRRIPAGLDAPERLPPGHPTHEVGDDVGHERGGNAGLDLAPRAVLEGRLRRGHRGGGVRHVVGDDLVGVDAAARPYRGAGLVDQALGQVDRVGGAGEVRCGGRRHGERP